MVYHKISEELQKKGLTMEKISKHNLNEIADAVIEKVLKNDDPFRTVTVVCHNTKVAQWFKTYYLKKNVKVLMNVEFMTLSQFIGDIVNPDRKYTLLDRVSLRRYLMKVLSDPDTYGIDKNATGFPKDYIYNADDTVKGIGLFELSGKLATLFLRYELEKESFSGSWEEVLYQKTMELAENDGHYTVKRLFEKKKEEMKYPEGPVYVINNSYVSELFPDIMEGGDSIFLYSVEDPEQKAVIREKIISAPSRVREIEAVHTEICKAIQSDKSAGFSDFAVYAPNISDYANTIHRVFEQDDKEFPTIPYRIAGETKDREDMADSLAVLFDIATKRFFTRNDFYRFVKNPIIKRGKDISDDEIEMWMDAIVSTNTHRNGKAEDDWDYLVKRMMLSEFVSGTTDYENRTELGGTGYLPYASMGLDRYEMSKMCDMISLLSDWSSLFTKDLKDESFDGTRQEEMLAKLDAIYSRVSCDGDELNYFYRGVKEELEDVRDLNIELPGDALLSLLMDVPSRFSLSPADLFAGGVTFLSLNCDDIVSAKYIYGIGLSSDAFPRIEKKSELDLGGNKHKSEDLDKMSIENILANAEHVTFSYVNCDLQKDAPFYPSPLITELYHYSKIEDILERIPLDESRPYEDLFTKKEFKNRKYYEEMGAESVTTGEGAQDADTEKESTEAEEKTVGDAVSAASPVIGSIAEEPVLKVTELKKYLENTFVYKYKKLLGDSKDADDILDEYEPIDVNGLVKHSDIKEMIMTGFAAGSSGAEAEEKDKLIMEKRLPEAEIGDEYFEYYHGRIVATLIDELRAGNFGILNPEPLRLVSEQGVNWKLENNVDIYVKEEGTDLYYIEPQDYFCREVKNKHHLNSYVFSLMDLAGRKSAGGEDEPEYVVHLGPKVTEKKYQMKPSEARDKLNAFYSAMTDYDNIRYMDIENVELIQKNMDQCGIPNPPKTVGELKNGLGGEHNHSEWAYFSDRRMADPEKDFGYGSGDISKAFLDTWQQVRDLIAFDLG